MSNKCYIVGAGDNSGTIFTREKDDYVIAADGGLEVLKKLSVSPNLIIGDFDSLGYEPIGDNVIKLPVKKDETDMMVAISKAIDLGYREVVIFGGTGGRIDHTIANLQTMLDASNKDIFITMVDRNNEYYMLTNGMLEIEGAVGKGFSVFAFGGDAKGVTIQGGLYEASNTILCPNYPTAISNSFNNTSVKITVTDGSLLIIKEK